MSINGKIRTKCLLSLIGGVSYSDSETLDIDVYVFSQLNKKDIHILLIDFASSLGEKGDKYLDRLKDTYGKVQDYNITLERLNYDLSKSNHEYVKSVFEKADVLYLGGGDPLRLYDALNEINISEILETYLMNPNKAIIGKSAGAVVLFEKFIYPIDETGEYAYSNGLGIVNGLVCAHFSEKGRQSVLKEFSEINQMYGIGIDELCSLIIKDNTYKVISIKENASGWLYDINTKNITNLSMHKLQLGNNNIFPQID